MKKSVAIALTATLTALFANEGGPGPTNPKMVETVEGYSSAKIKGGGGQYFTTGLRPSPKPEEVYVPQKHSEYPLLASVVLYPSRYDLSDPNGDGVRDDSNVTSIKNQSSCGVCWAFAAYGAYEGALKIDGLGTYDLSEQNLRYTNGTEWSNSDPCSGGNLDMVSSYLMRGSGPVLESDDPYDLTAGNTYNPGAQRVRYVDNVIELPIRNIDYKFDIDYIKDAIYTDHRPLFVNMQVGSGTAGEIGTSVWDDTSKSYYCNGGGSPCPTNHTVVIVGWDDTYQAQGQTGAFIVRNSWGETWYSVTDGYFYVPYADDSIALSGRIGYFYDVDDSEYDIDTIYQHDELPLAGSWGSPDSTPYWAANKFAVSGDFRAKAVSFYAERSNTTYEIALFKTISGTQGSYTFSNQVGTTLASATPIKAGWHTIALDAPVYLKEGETVIVQVKLSNPTGWPLPIECDYPGYVDTESSTGESYFGWDGVNFTDINEAGSSVTSFYTDPNFAIKLLGTKASPAINPSILMYLLN